MKTILIKFLGIILICAAFVACSDDDDSTPAINEIMMVYDTDTGQFSTVNLSNGALTNLGVVTHNGSTLTGLRDFAYHSGNGMLYASSRANEPYDGKIFRIDPTNLQATVINENANEDWYALPGLEMYNGQLLGTVYWDDYDYQEYSGLVSLDLDGTLNSITYLTYEDDSYNFSGGMALEFGDNNNELLIADEQDILRLDLDGNVTEIIELTSTGFPNGRYAAGGGGDNDLDYIRCLEKDANGILYGLDRDGVLGSINLSTKVFTYITEFDQGGNIVGLTKIPETLFQ